MRLSSTSNSYLEWNDILQVDDSADTGEYVDDLPEEHEQSSSE